MTFTDEEKLALFDQSTTFTIYPSGVNPQEDTDNLRHHVLEVVKCSDGQWMVWNASRQAWNDTEKKWLSSLLPELRESPGRERSRYELDEAISLAMQLRDTVKVNGRTYKEWREFFMSRQ